MPNEDKILTGNDDTLKATGKQPLSLEDAVAISEQVETELETIAPLPAQKNEKQPKLEVVQVEGLEELPDGTATYNPSAVMADIKADAPESVIDIPRISEEEFMPATQSEESFSEPEPFNISTDFSAQKAFPSVALEEDVLPSGPINSEEPVIPNDAIIEVAPIIDDNSSVSNKPKQTAAKKSAPAKKNTKAKTTPEATPVVAEPAAVAEPVVEAEKPAPEHEIKVGGGKKSNSKDAKNKKKAEKAEKKEEEKLEAEKAENEGADAEEKGKKKPKKESRARKIDPEKNFMLLKLLILVLSLFVTAISGHIFYTYIYDFSGPFAWEKLIPIAPFASQLLLLFLSFIAIGTSKRRPISAISAERKAIAQEVATNRAIKEIEDNLLVPEVNLVSRRGSELSNYQIDNFYKKNLEEINGKMYTTVAKFDESIRALEAMGATDMELIAVNMAGNSKFDEILDQPRTKTLSAQELTTYFLSKPNTYAIKKRGALNWTFKYSSKSFGIIRENEDSYKVSIKCYPDAAAKLNENYKALEDSNFPSGPLWFCFNELRNLPPRVCKWLIDTSCQISKLQQTKTDKLKDPKTPADVGIDFHAIAAAFKSGQKFYTCPKYTIVFSKGEDADLTTFLTREVEGVDSKAYTKEYYYKFTTSTDAISLLCGKGVNEETICIFMEHIEEILKM